NVPVVQGTPGQTRPQKPCLLRESLHRVRKPRAFKRGLFRRVESVSVGYQTRLQLNAFDIEEFLWTKGLGGAVTAFFA
ncbi:hypothetical protein, partial [Duodenibacillus massiliensis]|uniref:hypothetical protein n=1 Tax=Duodenibacillus massiliensis TaxID=1852381 RepID=UPI003077ABBA